MTKYIDIYMHLLIHVYGHPPHKNVNTHLVEDCRGAGC